MASFKYYFIKVASFLPYYLLSFFVNGDSTEAADEKKPLYIDYDQQVEDCMKTIEFKDDEVPNKSHSELVKLGMLYFAIELLFSMEVALTVPLMLKLKVSEDIYSYVYFLSPFVGFLVQPALGAYSDKIGQRKPFILALAIGAYIGIFLILNGYIIGQRLGDFELYSPIVAISLVAIGVTLLDFCADSCDSPLRAYLLDTCNTKAQETGLNIHAFLGGLGASLGFILTYIEWENTIFNFIGDELQILFFLTSIIFILCLVLTMSTIREAKPKTRLFSISAIGSDQCPKSEVCFKELLGSFVNIPIELKRLLVCQTVGWLALFSTQLFFTDFIAQAIYKGDPAQPTTSIQFKLYNTGVKMGCLCLFIFSLTSSLSAVLVEKFLIKQLSMKSLYLITFALYVMSCLVIYCLNDIYFIIPFCSTFGLLLTILTTVPYNIISEFHTDTNYLYRITGSKRGLGADCSLLSSCFFFAQALISLFMSYLTYRFGNRVILVVAAFFGTVGAFLVEFFVIFPTPVSNKLS